MKQIFCTIHNIERTRMAGFFDILHTMEHFCMKTGKQDTKTEGQVAKMLSSLRSCSDHDRQFCKKDTNSTWKTGYPSQ